MLLNRPGQYLSCGSKDYLNPVLISLLAFFSMIFLPSVLQADLATQYGLSARGIGMANAVSAIEDGGTAAFYNPAGLALTPESSLSLGYSYGRPRVKVKDENGQERSVFEGNRHSLLVGYKLGLAGLMPDKWKRNLGLGLGVALHDKVKNMAHVDTKMYQEMQFPVIGRARDILVFALSGGIELVPKRVYVGIGLNIGLSLELIDFAGIWEPEFKIPFELQGEYLDTNVETEARPMAGIILSPWDSLRFGAVWRRGGAVVTVLGGGGLNIRLGDDDLQVIYMSFDTQDVYVPEEISGSIAYQVSNELLLAVEVTHTKWSDYFVPYSRIPPGNPFIDIIIPRFGAEYALSEEMRFWMGYFYEPSAVKSYQPHTQFMDADKHVVSLSGEYSKRFIKRFIKRPIVFSAFGQFFYLPNRSIETVNGVASISGNIVHIGLSFRLPY